VSTQTFDTRIGRKFIELIEERKATLTHSVMSGMKNEREYAWETGRFVGLREALELYEEAEAITKGAERS
jgi:hypothetical protein